MEQLQQASPDLGGGRGRAKISNSFLSCYHKQRSTRLEAKGLGGFSTRMLGQTGEQSASCMPYTSSHVRVLIHVPNVCCP